jgi:S1-C subfamily serine protease
MLKRASGALAAALLAAVAAPCFAQTKDDPSEVHKKMHKKIAPAVVYVRYQGQSGSGVVIDKDGYLLTSPTACGSTSTDVTIQLPGQKRVVGKVIGRVNELELVVVKVAEKNLPAVELGDSDGLKLGCVTYAFGDSYGSIEADDQVAISLGVLSSRYEIDTKLQRGTYYTGPVLETSCAVNPNQDGGPLVDCHGKLIGIITLNYQESKFTGVAVPINRLKPEIERIIKEHRTGIASKPPPPTPDPSVKKGEPGWLGAEIEEVEEVAGLVVRKIFKNGPAEKAGLKKGDVIKQANKQRILTKKRYEEILGKLEEGASVTFRVSRDGAELDVAVTLGKKIFY